jgi:hypothetical protein
MIFPRRWCGWRFREITGEIFFARSPRAGRAGPTARKLAGRKSPVPKAQVIDFIESHALQKFSANNASLARRSAGILLASAEAKRKLRAGGPASVQTSHSMRAG